MSDHHAREDLIDENRALAAKVQEFESGEFFQKQQAKLAAAEELNRMNGEAFAELTADLQEHQNGNYYLCADIDPILAEARKALEALMLYADPQEHEEYQQAQAALRRLGEVGK